MAEWRAGDTGGGLQSAGKTCSRGGVSPEALLGGQGARKLLAVNSGRVHAPWLQTLPGGVPGKPPGPCVLQSPVGEAASTARELGGCWRKLGGLQGAPSKRSRPRGGKPFPPAGSLQQPLSTKHQCRLAQEKYLKDPEPSLQSRQKCLNLELSP